MTLPTIVDITTGDDAGTGATSHTVNLPGSIVSGERLILEFSYTGGTGGGITWPGTFTGLVQTGTDGQTILGIAYRDCDGSEGSSVTVTTAASRACAWKVTRITAGTFKSGVAPEVGTVATGNSTGPDCPSLSPSWGNKDALWFASAAEKSAAGAVSVTTWPTDFTNNQTLVSSANTAVLVSSHRAVAGSSQDPSAYTISASRQWAANTIAIQGADATTTNQTISATEGNTVTFAEVKNAVKTISASAASAMTMVRSAGKIISATAGSAMTMTRLMTRVATISASAASAATVAFVMTYLNSISASASSVMTMVRQTSKIITAAASNSAVVEAIKATLQTISATADNVVDIVADFIEGAKIGAYAKGIWLFGRLGARE